MSVILADVGNTSVALAVRGAKGLRAAEAINHGAKDFRRRLRAYLRRHACETLVAGSVNRQALDALRSAAEGCGVERVWVAGRDFRVPITNRTARPAEVGPDRLLAALASWDSERKACVVVDAGSAITVDVVDANGAFLGGAILPGSALAAQGLHQHTDLLPLVEPVPMPPGRPGRTTKAALRLGVWAATAGGVSTLVERARGGLGRRARVYLTGGGARLVAGAIKAPKTLRLHLVLEGLAVATRDGRLGL